LDGKGLALLCLCLSPPRDENPDEELVDRPLDPEWVRCRGWSG
jgi:hypothetical protein